MTSDDKQQGPAERHAAFEAIVSRHESALLRYATRLLNNNVHAAQDVVQDAFIRLFEKWSDELKDDKRLSVWLYSVTHNCAVDYIRKESRRSILHKQDAESRSNVAEPDIPMGEGIHSEMIAGAMGVLDVRERQMVILKILEDKSYREISEITGLTVSNVGYILHHAIKKMTAVLKKAQKE